MCHETPAMGVQPGTRGASTFFRHAAIFPETDHTVLGILVKFARHIPDFPICSDGTNPGTFQLIPFQASLHV